MGYEVRYMGEEVPNDEHLSAISFYHSIPRKHAGSLVPAFR